MNYKIEELTKQRKDLEKQLKKAKRKLKFSEFLSCEVSNGRHSRSTPWLWGVGPLLSVGLGVGVFFLLPYLSTAGIVISLIVVAAPTLLAGPCVDWAEGGCYFWGKEVKRLKKEREEVVKHIDCLRKGEQYVAPPTKQQEPEEKHESLISKIKEELRIRALIKEEERQKLIEKARLRNIDAERILQGPKAFDSKQEYKEAKKELKNFMEEDSNNFRFY